MNISTIFKVSGVLLIVIKIKHAFFFPKTPSLRSWRIKGGGREGGRKLGEKINKGEKIGRGTSFPFPLRPPTSPFFLFHKPPLPPLCACHAGY